MPFLIDSNVLIDVSRGKIEAIQFVDALPEPWSISQVTSLELIVGARDKREAASIDNLLSLYPVAPLTESTGSLAYALLRTYAKSHGLDVFDSLIAATAMENRLTLVTLNRKHYQMIEGLKLLVPDYTQITAPSS